MAKLSAKATEGRAGMARPSLCVLAVAIVACLALAGSAHAALLAPVLASTNPVSPGASLTPRIQGEIPEEGGGTKVVLGVGLRGAGPITRTGGDPGNTVRLYTEPGCTGPVAGVGTVEDLEGAGVQASPAVTPDAVTTFYAREIDPVEGESPCSTQGIAYRQVTNPPGAPVLESVTPASPANDNLPRLTGSANPEATVSIHTSASCAGTAIASGPGSAFASPGIQVNVPDNSETTFWAKATFTVHFEGGGTGDFASGCSAAPITYQEVTPPPGDPGGGGVSGGAAASRRATPSRHRDPRTCGRSRAAGPTTARRW